MVAPIYSCATILTYISLLYKNFFTINDVDSLRHFLYLLSHEVENMASLFLIGNLFNTGGVFVVAIFVRNDCSALSIEDWIGILSQFLEPCNGALIAVQFAS